MNSSGQKGKKVIPDWIEEYLSPMALAIWIKDDRGWIKNRGVKLSSNCFTLKEVKFLVSILEKKYDLSIAIHSAVALDLYNIYFPKKKQKFTCFNTLSFTLYAPLFLIQIKYG